VVYPIGLANLVLHGIDDPHIWHGNSLSEIPTYAGLFDGAPKFFDYVLMNPPFGGKEGKEAQTPYEYKTGATQVLFIQDVLHSMKPGSRCGIVLDEGVLFRVDAEAFVQTKRKLLEESDVYCIVSLPGGVFSSAGAGVKTNLVFFDKGKQTERIWYYDLSDIKVGKKTRSRWRISKNFSEFYRSAQTANGVGRSISQRVCKQRWRKLIRFARKRRSSPQSQANWTTSSWRSVKQKLRARKFKLRRSAGKAPCATLVKPTQKPQQLRTPFTI